MVHPQAHKKGQDVPEVKRVHHNHLANEGRLVLVVDDHIHNFGNPALNTEEHCPEEVAHGENVK